VDDELIQITLGVAVALKVILGDKIIKLFTVGDTCKGNAPANKLTLEGQYPAAYEP
jgi:hypothetical protein